MLDFAKHGYIVFAIDHLDKTCTFTYGKDGEMVLLDATHKLPEK